MRISPQHQTILAIALINAAEGIVSMIFPPFLSDRAYKVSEIGLIVSFFGILSLVSRIPTGMAYRPQKARQMLWAALALFAGTSALFSLVHGTTELILVQGLSGFAYGAATTLNMAMFMDTLSGKSSRARAMAFYAAGMAGGFAVGNFAGGWLTDVLGYGWTFVIAAIPSIAAVVCTPRIAATSTPATARIAKGRWTASVSSKFGLVASGPFLAIVLLSFMLNSTSAVIYTFFPLYGLAIGLNMTSIGLLRGTQSLMGTLTRPLCGEITRFVSAGALSNGGLLVIALLIALIPSFDSLIALVPLFMLFGAARGVALVGNAVGMLEEIGDDPAKRGIASGMFNFARDLGVIVGPALGGLVASATSIETMMRLIPAVVMAFYLVAVPFSIWRRRKARALFRDR